MRSVKMKFTAMVLAACVLASATGEVDAVARENKAAESEGFGAELASMIRETTDKAGKKVSVKVTNIPATSLSQVEGGYVSVTFEAEYQYEKHQDDGTTAFYGQTALVDGNGKFLIPFEYGATKIYSSNDGVISYANDSFGAGVQTETAYDRKTYLSKYYDTNLKELFKSDLADAGAAYDGMITSPTTIYDAKGNVTYELPADLQNKSNDRRKQNV